MIRDSLVSDFDITFIKVSATEKGMINPKADMANGDLKLWKNFG